MSKSSPVQNYKIMILGECGVGKTSIVMQLVKGEFSLETDPTVEDVYSTTITLDNDQHKLEIHDSVSCSRNSASSAESDQPTVSAGMRDIYINHNEGFIIVFDVTQRSTFEEVVAIKDELFQKRNVENLPVCIVGNKRDLSQQCRQVASEEAQSLSRQCGANYVETSAKDNINIDACFIDIVRKIKRYRAQQEAQKAAEDSKCHLM